MNKLHKYNFFWEKGLPLFLMLFLLGTTACNNKKYILPGQHLVVKNTVAFDTASIPNQNNIKYGLSTLIRQRPNQKLVRLFKTRLWIYNHFKADCERCKFKKWMRNKVGEPPVLLDTVVTQKTQEAMVYYMNARGYFNASATHSIDTTDRLAKITYLVHPGPQLLIDSIAVDSRDSAVLALVKRNKAGTLLKKGAPVDSDVFNAERNRIVGILRNEGYYQFFPNYIYYDVDTANSGKGGNVYFNILPATEQSNHHKFTIDSIFLVNVRDQNERVRAYDTTYFENAYFLKPANDPEKLFVHPSVLKRLLTIHADSLYRTDQVRATSIDLRDLSAYKKVSIEMLRGKGDHLNARINLLKAKKLSFGADLETSTYNTNVGISGSVFLRHNNLFHRAATLSVGMDGGIELNLSRAGDLPLVNTSDLNVHANVFFPRSWIARKIFKVNSGRTRISFQFSRLNRTGLFSYDSYNANYANTWYLKDKRHQFNYQLFNASLLLPTLDSLFKVGVVDPNPFLTNTFSPFVIFGAVNGINYTYNGLNVQARRGWTIRAHTEAAGSLINLVDRIFNPADTLRFFQNSIDYSQFIQADVDVRYSMPVRQKSTLAFRGFLGVGIPFGNSKVMPYVRQYFVGGTNSIRAWRVRELGPGGYVRPASDTLNVRPDLTGDMRLEVNAELRFPLFYIFEGAIFVDAGNVWLLRNDPSRPGAQFTFSTFADQIAIGSGVGIRANFTYFVLRLDVGQKVKTPYDNLEWGGNRWVDRFAFKYLNYNLAIAYPF